MNLHTLWKDTRGQDLLEYALLAGVLATSVAAIAPPAVAGMTAVFSRVAVYLSMAATQGS